MMKKILLIEDDKVMRENTAEILSLAHYDVSVASDGLAGVQLAKQISPDLVICDIMLPKLDGYGVLHVLAKDPQTMGIPFVFLTAKAEKSEIRRGMELGADDYLTKPFDDTELLSVVEVRLNKNQLLKKQFARGIEGLNQFLDEARGFKELESLSRKRPIIHFKKKDVIFHEETVPQNLFLLVQGKVKTYRVHDDGKEYITGLYAVGDFMGYLPLLKGSLYLDTAVAMEDSQLAVIQKDEFIKLVYRNRDVAHRFFKLLAGDIVDRESQMLSLAYDTVRRKVASALLRLESRYHEIGKKSFGIKINRDDLASITGTATETVIRSLSELKDENLIEMHGREIIILDLEGLKRIQ